MSDDRAWGDPPDPEGALGPDPSVTRELFLEWRSPRRGTANPERLTNPVWCWLARCRWNAWRAAQHFEAPSALEAGPGWCFDRFGQTSTRLPDGRLVFIAGEHEDHYDPDFFIYNDVVVVSPDGRMEIYGYPTEAFPPTDFHTATRVGERIILIGSLGYPDGRQPGVTPVRVLGLTDFVMRELPTSGQPPGWIHGHEARLSDDGGSILVVGGKRDRGDSPGTLVESLDEWRLHLSEGRWERLTDRRWPRWEIRRKDRRRTHLWEYLTAAWEQQRPELRAVRDAAGLEGSIELPSLEEQLGGAPDFRTFQQLYQPPVDHDPVPEPEGEHGIRRIRVQGIVVRYVEDFLGVQVTFEGELPDAVLGVIVQDLTDKLSRLEHAGCEAVRL